MPDRTISISSPVRDYVNLPMTLTLKDLERPSGGDWALEDIATGECLVLQAEAGWWSRNAWMRFILPEISKGQTREFRLRQVDKEPRRCSISEAEDESLEIRIDDNLVTRYHFASKWARPFLWPLIGPGGTEMTRAWPVDEREGEQTDHEHHKSVWTAHGDVNGGDNWTEHEGHARTEHDTFEEKVSGPVFCRFSTKQNWVRPDGNRIMRSYNDVTVYALPEHERVLDFTICFRALSEPVKFGDTKEGGLLSVRVATPMCGSNGGLIENAYGALTENENWGKPAPWVDYSGELEGGILGISIFDHPDNLLYPTRWHVRDYGLFTANPFALHDYLGDETVDGSRTLQLKEVWKFQYRVYLHRGRAADAGVREKYLAFISPPAVTVGSE